MPRSATKLGGTPNPLASEKPAVSAADVKLGAFKKGSGKKKEVWFKAVTFTDKNEKKSRHWVDMSSPEDPTGSMEKKRLQDARKKAKAKREAEAAKPASKKPASKKPASKKPAAKKPASKKPAAKKPASKRPKAASTPKKAAAKRPKA